MYPSCTYLLAQIPTDHPLPKLLRLPSVVLFWPFIPYFSRLGPSYQHPKPFSPQSGSPHAIFVTQHSRGLDCGCQRAAQSSHSFLHLLSRSTPSMPPSSWHLQARKRTTWLPPKWKRRQQHLPVATLFNSPNRCLGCPSEWTACRWVNVYLLSSLRRHVLA